MTISKAKKVIIVGDSCRGKTTFAKHLSKTLKIKAYFGDDFYFIKKYSIMRDKKESVKKIKKVYDKNSWIVESSTKKLLEPGLKKADLIICLKHKFFLGQIFLLFRRGFKRKDEKIVDTLKLSRHLFYRWYQLNYEKNRIQIDEFLEPYNNKVVILNSFRKMNEFLENIK